MTYTQLSLFAEPVTAPAPTPTYSPVHLVGVTIHWPMVALHYTTAERPLYFVVKDVQAQARVMQMVREWMGI